MRTGLALPPDSSENFAREVDENLRRDHMAEMAKSYGKWVIAALVLFLAGVAGILYYKDRQTKQAEAGVEQLVQTLTDVGQGKDAAAKAQLTDLSKSGSDGVSTVARLTSAALALQKGDRATASKTYAEIAADSHVAGPFRDLALLRGTALDYDTLKPDEVVSRLQPLTIPGNPYFGSAGELTGMALLAQNRRPEAAQLFAKIAADLTVPASLRERAVQIAGSLGVDATASMPGGLTLAPALAPAR